MINSERGQGLFKWVFYIIVAIAVFMLGVSIVSGFIMDYYWFGAVGYQQVFMTNLKYQLILLFLAWAATTICLLLAWRGVKSVLDVEVPAIAGKVFTVFSVLIGFGFGWWMRGNYMIVLKFLNQVSWGVTDPVFTNDISYYVFTLPFLKVVLTFLGVLAGVVLVVSIFSFGVLRSALREEEELEFEFEEPSGTDVFADVFDFLKSWNVLGPIACLTGVGAAFVWLGRYSYLWEFSPGAQVPTGAAHMAVKYHIPYTWVETIGVILIGVLIIYILRNAEELRYRLETSGLLSLKKVLSIVFLLIVIFAIIPGVVFGVINSLEVQPNEPGIQQSYIESSINYTRKAYALDDISEFDYPVATDELSPEEALESSTVKNARIVDYRPVKSTYEQKQRLRTYYEFPDVDVDRYSDEDGKRLAIISGREMVPQDQGWQNTHLFFTHGYGVVASPANEVASDGSPILAVRDIPPVSDWESAKVDNPRIYFGERTDRYSIVRADGLDEFDYPMGGNNIQYRYEYDRGITLDSVWKKLVGWFYTGDFNVLVSDYVGEESRLLLHRNVRDRVQKIAPFLNFDPNNHLFVGEDRRIHYLVNGLSWAERYPYSYSNSNAPGYLSDSVKAFIEANTGDTKFYIIDEEDPMAETYSNIYPDLFKKEEDMPETYREHLIYPESLFKAQMDIYRRYHMSDYQAFYQKEDMWAYAEETYHTRSRRVEPYNMLFDLTGYSGFENNEEEFTLVQPFTPEDKQNMVSWIGVTQDSSNYGKTLALRFPKGELSRGPSQIESIISQETEISRQFTLWEGAGSEVLRGNLLVLPVKNDLLYIEPVYLSAEDTAYPQLKRVIAVYRDRAAMRTDLESAVRTVLHGGPAVPGDNMVPGDNIMIGELGNVVREYLDLSKRYHQLTVENRYAQAGEVREDMLALERKMADLLEQENIPVD